MSRRAALLLAVFVADWLAFLPARLGYAHPHTSLARLFVLVGPSIVVCVVAVAVALRARIFSRAELGLEPTEFQRERGLVGKRGYLALLGVFIAGALTHMFPPVNFSLLNGFSHAEFLELLRQNEWRSNFARCVPPVDFGDVALVFLHGVILAPLTEEIPYRALFVPTVLPYLGRVGTAIAAGLVFLGLHVLVYGRSLHGSYFLVGAALVFIFLWFGLRGALLFHGGCNFGLLVLALYVELNS